MKSARITFASAGLGALLAAAFTFADEPSSPVRTGMIVSVEKAAVAIEDRGTRYAYVVPTTATITLDGTAAKLADLQAGDTAKITADRAGDSAAATLIEAQRQSDDLRSPPVAAAAPDGSSGSPPTEDRPETEMISGKVVMTGQDRLVALVNGQEQMFKVSPTAEIRKDGNVVMLAALSRHDLLNLSARRSGADLLIERIEAKSAY